MVKFLMLSIFCGLPFIHAENANIISSSAYDLNIERQLCPCGCGCKGPCKCGCVEGKACNCHVKDLDHSHSQINPL